MPYEPTYSSTTTTPYDVVRPTAIHPPMTPGEIPPGVEIVTLPNGTRTLAYTSTPPAGPALVAVEQGQPIPRWAKTTALLAPTVGGGVAAASLGLAHAAPGLNAMTETLWSAGALAAVLAAAPLLWRASRPRTRQGGAGPVQHITQNITASGMFGRATGTFNQR
ncbi:hypothetical protein [Streptomyces sp. NPDC093225]|uniref:hypothetical protein n=1 Tax=Streptomyces sp. NPDC093225 TaxID=3366034 RepID=UPI0037F1D792